MSTQQICHECGEPAAKLCDFRGPTGRLCDRPMCAYHAHQQSKIHCYGVGTNGRRKSWWDTIDYCAEHAKASAEPAGGPTP